MTTMTDLYGETPLARVTRARLIEDGALVEMPATDLSRIGLGYPVAVTRTLHELAIRWPEGHRPGRGESEAARRWDVLSMLRFCLQAQRRNMEGKPFPLTVWYLMKAVPQTGGVARRIVVRVVIDRGDDGKPCITLAERDEPR